MKKKKTKTAKTRSKRYLVVDSYHGIAKVLSSKASAEGYLIYIGRSFPTIEEFMSSVSVYEVGKKVVMKAVAYEAGGYRGNTLDLIG